MKDAANLGPVNPPRDHYIDPISDKEAAMPGERSTDRVILKITGQDRLKFLQDLITNDIRDLEGRIVYAALLTPQGKYLFDFFLFARDDALYLDVHKDCAGALVQRLTMYKLRADVTIETSALKPSRGLGDMPKGAMADPRHPALGWRYYGIEEGSAPEIDWQAIRVAHLIPETGAELIANDSYILEQGFERLNGVDFKKGCYVGQEVTARMKHKTTLRKGLVRVELDGKAAPGTEISKNGKKIGQLHTVAGNSALAYLRLDQAGEDMLAGDAGLKIAAGPG